MEEKFVSPVIVMCTNTEMLSERTHQMYDDKATNPYAEKGTLLEVLELCLEHSVGEDENNVMLDALIDVLSGDASNESLILFIKDIERSIMGNLERYKRLEKLDKIDSRLVIIGSHMMDFQKEKGDSGAYSPSKSSNNLAPLLDLLFLDNFSLYQIEDLKGEGSDRDQGGDVQPGDIQNSFVEGRHSSSRDEGDDEWKHGASTITRTNKLFFLGSLASLNGPGGTSPPRNRRSKAQELLRMGTRRRYPCASVLILGAIEDGHVLKDCRWREIGRMPQLVQLMLQLAH
eukprot:Gb_40814 [translate_table: standard]